MIAPRAGLTALLLAAASLPAQAQLYPAARAGMIPKDVAVVDERGRAADLMELVRGAGPAILLPIFTQCAGTCPLLAEHLKTALGRQPQAGFRVVVFSFDASDTDADLRSFRRDHSLSENWTIVRTASAGAARNFLDQFGYAVMQSGPGFVHPSEAFVLSGQGRWSGTFAGDAFSPEALKSAAREAEEIDSPAPSSRLRSGLSRPQIWIGLAAAAFVLGVAGAVVLSLRTSRT